MKSALSLRSSQRGFYNGYLQRINCDMPCQRPASEKIQVSVVSLGSREIQWNNSLVIECFFSLFFWPLNPFNHVFGMKVYVSNWQLSEATVIIVRIQGRHTFFIISAHIGFESRPFPQWWSASKPKVVFCVCLSVMWIGTLILPPYREMLKYVGYFFLCPPRFLLAKHRSDSASQTTKWKIQKEISSDLHKDLAGWDSFSSWHFQRSTFQSQCGLMYL